MAFCDDCCNKPCHCYVTKEYLELRAERDALKAELEGLKKLDPSDLKQLEQYKEFRNIRADRDRFKKLAGELAEATRRVLDTHLRQERVVDMRQALKKYDSISKEAR